MKINKCLLVKLLKEAQQQINEKRLYGVFALIELSNNITDKLIADYVTINKVVSIKNWDKKWTRIEFLIIDKLQIKL